MTPTAIERENRSGGKPERLDTAIERGDNISATKVDINHDCHCITPCPTCVCRGGEQ